MKALVALFNFFKPMWRTIWIALAGQGVFIISVITMSPLRIWKKPIVNYNLYYVPILAIFFGFLFYRACVEEKQSKGFLYGFFAALVAWPLIGEVASIPVDKGIVTQFSSVDIKLLGGYYYVIAGWIILKILWRTQALKSSICVFFLTFLCIWTFELYMENYTANVPIEMMPKIANYVAIAFTVISLLILIVAKRTPSVEKKTVMGCLLYITVSLVIMGSGQWKKPNNFYLKYESAHIDHELEELQEEKEYLEYLRNYLIKEGLAKEEDLVRHEVHEEPEQKVKPQGE